MKLSDFDFDLPKQLIAQVPASPRDSARLLVYDRKTKQITDDYFYNLDKYLKPSTTLVLNNSKVEKCRLRLGATEIFVVETKDPQTVVAMVKPGKKFKAGSTHTLDLGADKLSVEVLAVDEDGLRTLRLSKSLADPLMIKHALTPLPPYIAQDETLSEEYQTVYSKPLGSKAAPTAGLHFTPNQLSDIRKSHAVAELTLHVGLGTFAPVKVDNLDEHKMHHEWYQLDLKNADILNRAQHIPVVGTTSARTLESLSRPFAPTTGETNIFIKPGYEFKNVDSLITNFHLPKSTLLMLVSAFMGSVEQMHRVYQHAINNSYRFYSFGDAMLIV